MSDKYLPKDHITTGMRLPKEIWDDIQELAEKEERSANYMIVKLLKRALELYPKT